MTGLYGVMAEFAAGEEAVAGAWAARRAGYAAIDIYSPFPVEGASEALDFRTRLPAVTLIAGALGGAAMFGFQSWVHVFDWAIDVGGRRHFAAPAFIVPTFEVTILIAALATVIAMFARNGLPRPHHPLFAVAAFERASQDRFFLIIVATDPRFEVEAARAFLRGLGPLEVHDVPA